MLTADLDFELSGLANINQAVLKPEPHGSGNKKTLLSILDKLTEDVKELADLYERNSRLALNNNQSAVTRLSKNDSKIKKFTLANEFLSLAAQSIILSITESGEEVSSQMFYSKMNIVAAGQYRHLQRCLTRLNA